MAKNAKQKLKILYIMQMLTEETDEEHALTTADIISRLKAQGVNAERKSIYDDIENLKLFGLDILSRRSEPKGYYIASRDFELPELKLLVDAVQSSKFITAKKSNQLISKIEKLAGKYEAKQLQSQVVVSNRIKTMNESIYYNVDKIHSAISENVKIRLKYCEWTLNKELTPKRNGDFYILSPWVMTWDDENYYLIAYDDKSGQLRHYRVDKMMNITLTNEAREGREHFQKFDIASYARKTFGMFAGEEKRVRLRFLNHLAGAVIDRFGKDLILTPDGEEHFIVSVDLVVSPQFYAWVFGFGSEVEILSPESVRREMGLQAAMIAAQYV